MTDSRSDLQLGLEMGLRMGGDSFKGSIKSLNAIDPALAEFLVAFGYGKIMRREHLSLHDKELVIISTLAVLGLLPQLKWHLNAALNIGVQTDTLTEVLAQAIPFAGWPIALNALGSFREVLVDQGITLATAVDSEEVAVQKDPVGTMTAAQENGLAVYAEFDQLVASLAEIDPTLPELLLESSFGRIYSRPGLSLKQRELVAVAMLAALQRLPQLEGHLRGAIRTGSTPRELSEALILIHGYAGWPVALNALGIWKKVVAS